MKNHHSFFASPAFLAIAAAASVLTLFLALYAMPQTGL